MSHNASLSVKKSKKRSPGSSTKVKKTVRDGKLTKQKKKQQPQSSLLKKPSLPSDGDEAKKKKRKEHKWKAGTLAAMEVRRYQTGKKATTPIITFRAIEDLMRDTIAECGGDLRIQRKAVHAARDMIEDEAARLFESALTMAQHADRETIDIRDFHAAAKVVKIRTGKEIDSTKSRGFWRAPPTEEDRPRKKREKLTPSLVGDTSQSTQGPEAGNEETSVVFD